MALKTKLEVLAGEDYTRVHEASLKILRETGIVFHSEEALAVLKKHGAVVSDKTAFISKEMVDRALESSPGAFKWQARNDQHSVTVGEGFLIQPNVGPVYIQDLDGGRRNALLSDYSNIQKLCQASSAVNLVGTIPVDPSDVPGEQKHLHMMYEILKNTDKPVIGFCSGARQVREQLDMVELAMGREGFLQENSCVSVLVNPLSPLSYGPETLETMMEFAGRNQPILLAPCIMAGVTGPVSLLGTAVLQNTEILAGLVLMQLIRPGTPVVYSTASTAAYMKAASFGAGAPEAMLINTASLQMGLDYYRLPTRTMCGITHSKAVDYQAGFETMQSLLLGRLSGAHIAVQCLGVLDAIMATSYEKFVIDEELISRVARISKGIDTSEDALAVDVIQEMGHKSDYLMHSSTFEQYRNIWIPGLSDWESYDDWLGSGGEDIAVRANRRFKEILGKAPDTLLDPELDKDLRAYMDRALKG